MYVEGETQIQYLHNSYKINNFIFSIKPAWILGMLKRELTKKDWTELNWNEKNIHASFL